MMGIKSLNARREAFFVTYDLMEVSLEDIEKTIERILGKIDSPMIELTFRTKTRVVSHYL